MNVRDLPRAAPARVLALGAWLKNAACRVDGTRVTESPLHGDLGTPEACVALERSAEALLALGPVDAVAHDLHPDFPSTRLAQALAARLGVPALGVQHHHAHVAVVLAEQGWTHEVAGLALDGVGLGTDGTAWGGELLCVQGARSRRLAHLPPLALPGGDVAAREPWRMGAALLHALGRGEQIVPRFAPLVGTARAAGVEAMLARGLNCPATTAAGRWFDAIAGLLGLSLRQQVEAEAAQALERVAAAYIATHGEPAVDDAAALDLLPLARACLADGDTGRAAARFHAGLAAALARALRRHAPAREVVLAGGCFYNRVLRESLARRLPGFRLVLPQAHGPGDAGLALGQAWAAACALAEQPQEESLACA